MSRKSLVIMLIVCFALTIVAAGCGGGTKKEGAQATTPSKVYKFKIQSVNPSSSLYFEILQNWGKSLEKASGGRLQAEVLPDGAIVPAFEVLDAVSKGVVEAGNGWTNYWSGKHPASTLFGAPPAGAGYGMDQYAHLSWFYMGGGQELATEFYQTVLKADVVPFLFNPVGPDPMGWFKNEIKTYDDMKKIKFRTPPGIPGEIYKRIGISAVAVPGGEIVPSAQKGVIDAAEWISPADDYKLGLHQIWKHYYLQGLHQSTDVGDIFFNKKFWDSLPADLQELMKVSIKSAMMETIYTNIAKNGEALEKYRNEHGVQVHDTPKELYEQYLKEAKVVMKEYGDKDPFFKKVLDSQRTFAAKVVPYQTDIMKLYFYMGDTATKQKE